MALFVHAVLALPAGHLRGVVARSATAVAYGEAAAAAFGYYRSGLVVTGGVIVFASVIRWVYAPDRATRSAVAGVAAGLVLGAGVFTTALLRMLPSPPSEPVLARGLFVPIIVTSVLVLMSGSAQLVYPSGIELDDDGGGALEATISQVLGVAAVSVAFPVAGGNWIAPSGEQMLLNDADIHVIRDSDGVVAALDSRAAVPDDVLDALLDLLRLSGTHARLQLDVRSRVDELTASRRRLLDAGDAERRQLEMLLRRGALARIDVVESILARANAPAALIERARITRNELDGVARGIDPLAAGCFEGVLKEMTKRCPLNVTTTVMAAKPKGRVARAIWYTCSEALANAAKHAPGSAVTISVVTNATEIVTTVVDDGPGGADPGGSGLRGLADRAAALGGSLYVKSGRRGTSVALVLPVESEV